MADTTFVVPATNPFIVLCKHIELRVIFPASGKPQFEPLETVVDTPAGAIG